jgi:hypothetical protein
MHTPQLLRLGIIAIHHFTNQIPFSWRPRTSALGRLLPLVTGSNRPEALIQYRILFCQTDWERFRLRYIASPEDLLVENSDASLNAPQAQ